MGHFFEHHRPKNPLHGLWFLLGAAGLGYFLGRKKKFKFSCKEGHNKEENTSCGSKKGWYGIADKEMDKEFREDIKHAEENNDKTVDIEQKVVNGYSTETILKRD